MPATLSRKLSVLSCLLSLPVVSLSLTCFILQKVLETKTDSPDLQVALQNLSSFYGANTPAARTNLRGEIEKRGLEINNNFLASFKEVQKVSINSNSHSLVYIIIAKAQSQPPLEIIMLLFSKIFNNIDATPIPTIHILLALLIYSFSNWMTCKPMLIR